MNWLNKPITKFLLIFLAVGFLSFGLLSALNMSHMDTNHEACPVASASNCDVNTDAASFCLDYHISIIKNSVTGIASGWHEIISLLYIASLGLVLYALSLCTQLLYARFRYRLKQFLEHSLAVYYEQLGFWIGIVENKAYSYSFVQV